MACNSDVRASSAQSPRYRLQGMSAPQRHAPAMLCQSTSPMRADCALSDENAKDYAAKIPQLIPACFAGERCCPKRGLSSRLPRSSSCRVVIATAVLEAASRELPAMNARRLKWCCSTACFGASGSAWDEATEQKHNGAQIAKAKRRTRTKHAQSGRSQTTYAEEVEKYGGHCPIRTDDLSGVNRML